MTTYPTADDLYNNHSAFRDSSILLLQVCRCRCYPPLRHPHGLKNLQISSTSTSTSTTSSSSSSSDAASDSDSKAVTSPTSASE